MANSHNNARDEVRGRLERLEDEFTELNSAVAAIQSSQISQLESLRIIQERVDRPPPQTNWLGVAALILSSAGTMGALGSFALAPVREQGAINATNIEYLRQASEQSIAVVGRFDEFRSHTINDLRDLSERLDNISDHQERVRQTLGEIEGQHAAERAAR